MREPRSQGTERSRSPFRFTDDAFCRERELRVLRAAARRIFGDTPYAESDRKDIEEVVLTPESMQGEGGGAPGGTDKRKQNVLRHAYLPKTLILMQGEGGMGRSRLLHELRSSLPFPAHTVRCFEVEGLPLKPVLRVIEDLLGECEDRQDLVEKYGEALRRTLPHLFEGKEDRDGGPLGAAERLKVFDGLAQLLIEISTRRPIAILVDDLHWSDRATIDLLRHIGRNVLLRNARADGEYDRVEDDGEWKTISPRQSPPREFLTKGIEEGIPPITPEGKARLLIVASYRPFPQEDHYIGEAVDELSTEPFALPIVLGPLPRAEAERLAAAAFGVRGAVPGLIERSLALTQGKPLYIEELALWLEEAGILAPDRAGEVTLEEVQGVSSIWSDPLAEPGALIRERLGRLPEAALAAAEFLAVARKPVPPSLVADCAGRSGDVAGAIEELIRRGFVQTVDAEDGEALMIRHWEHLQVIRQGMAFDRKAELHDQIADRLAAGCPEGDVRSLYEIFYHRKRGRTPTAAFGLGRAAADRLARVFCSEKAILAYLEVLENVPEEDGLESRVDILDRIATLEFASGRLEQAKYSFKQIFEIAGEKLGPERTAGLLIRFSEIYRLQGRWSRTQKILNRTFRLLRDADSPLVARIYERIAALRLERGDVKRAIDFSSKGLRAVEKADLCPEAIAIRRTMARAYLRKGDAALAADSFHRCLEAAEAIGERDAIPEILDELGRVYVERGNFFRAARYFYRSLEYRSKDGHLAGVAISCDELGRIYQHTSDPYKAIEHLCRSLEIRERLGDRAGLNPTLIRLGQLYAQMGQYQAAIRCLKRGIENAEGIGDTRALVECFVEIGRVYYLLGEFRQVTGFVTQVRILAEEFKLQRELAAGERLAGVIAQSSREWGAAEKSFRRAIEIYARAGDRREEAEAKLDLAELEYERENYEAAAKLVSQAGAVADGLRAPALQARSLLLKGNVHRFLKGGNQERAKEYLLRAVEIARSVNDLHLLFEVFYALARVHHYGREFGEAGVFYAKAEAVLRRIGDGLPEAMSQRFHEDKRRKLFFEDSARFQKEAGGRVASGAEPRTGAVAAAAVPTLSASEYRQLVDRLVQLARELRGDEFLSRLLGIGLDLVRADRGLFLRLEEGRPEVAASRGILPEAIRSPGFRGWEALAREALRRGKSVRTSGAEEHEKFGAVAASSGLREHGILVVPLAVDGRVLGAIYADRPSEFGAHEQEILELFVRHAAVSLENHRAIYSLERDPRTGFFVEEAFLVRLRRAIHLHSTRGRPIALVGAVARGVERRLEDVRALGREAKDDTLVRAVVEAVGEDAQIGIVQGSWIVALLPGATREAASERAVSLREALLLLSSTDSPIEVETAVVVPGREPSDEFQLFEVLREKLKSAADRLAWQERREAKVFEPFDAEEERRRVAVALRRNRFTPPGDKWPRR